jgi:hypothetical protein
MDFAQATSSFAALDSAYRQGRLDAAAYAAQVGRLRVTGRDGQLWQIQAHSGKWHVLRQGQWVEATPPVQKKQRSGLSWPAWLATGLAAGAVMGLCAVVAAAVLLVQSGRLPNPLAGGGAVTPAPLAKSTVPATPGGTQGATPSAPTPGGDGPSLTFRTTQAVVAAADGKVYSDKQGVSLRVPQGVLSGTIAAELQASEASGSLLDTIRQDYSVDTPFYRAYAQGANSGVRRATLSFAAASANSRLLAVLDGELVVPLAAEPVNGVITLPVRLGPQDATGSPWLGPAGAASDLRYVLVTPKKSAAPAERPVAGRGAAGLAAPAGQVDYRDYCNTPGRDRAPVCYSPGADVSVAWSLRLLVDFPQESGFKLAVAVRDMMKLYGEAGFAAAKFPPRHYVFVKVVGPGDPPRYSVQTTTLYVPLDVAKRVAAGERDSALLHELAHWIEHDAYWMMVGGMTPSYRAGARWWMEMAAENMVMLWLEEAAKKKVIPADPGFAAAHLAKYGKVAMPDGKLVLQHAAYNWIHDEGYVQAHLVRVNMCEWPACPFSQAGFVEAINKGTFPLDSALAKVQITSNRSDFARYLLGVAPIAANASATVGNATGVDYSQSINVVKNTKGDFVIDRFGEAPQIIMVGSGMSSAATIRAPLDQDGFYPLYVASGADRNTPSYPVELRVQPGAEIFYRLGGGEPIYHNGVKELVIAPIQKTLGASDLRLVAVGKSDGLVFQARLQLVDLQGAWVISPKKVLQDSISCSNVRPGDTPSLNANSTAALNAIATAAGRFTTDASGKSLAWSRVPAATAALGSTLDFQMSATVDIGIDNVRLRTNANAPKKTNALPLAAAPMAADPMATWPAPVATSFALVGAPAALLSWRASRKRLALVTLAATLLLLTSGCDAYGKVGADLVFTKMEYRGGQEEGVVSAKALVAGKGLPASEPLWLLTGKGTYTANATVATGTKDNPRTEVCTGTAEVEVEARVYKSVRVTQ